MDDLDIERLRRLHPTALKTLRLARCGDGWRDIVERCLTEIAAAGGDVAVTEIVEKMGRLRIHTAYDRNRRDVTRALVLAAHRSMYCCEVCGQPGELRPDRSWLSTRCATHRSPGAEASEPRYDQHRTPTGLMGDGWWRYDPVADALVWFSENPAAPE
jgi:hypothetical protein